MQIDDKHKQMLIEARDINYILPAYIRSYQFYSKNEIPTKIIFPMFVSVRAAGVDIPIEWVPPLEAIAVEIAKDGEIVAEVTPEQEAAIDDKEAETEALKAKMAELTEPPAPVNEYYLKWSEEGLTPEEQTYEAAKADQPTPAPEDLIRQQEENAQQAADEAADNILEIETESKTESPAKTAFAQPDRIPKQPPGGDIGPGQPLSDMGARDSRDQIQTAKDLAEEPEIEGTAEKPFGKEITRGEDGEPIVEDSPSATD